jgi:hypothetical protein
MNKRIAAFIAASAALLVAGYVVAQVIVVPQVTTLNPNNDVVQVIPNGAPAANEVYATPALLTNVYGYNKSVPLTGATFTFGKNVTYASINPAGTIAAYTITLAANPSDGARNCLFSTQIVTSLTVNANTGQSINSAASAMTANGTVCYIFSLSNATWDRSQ